MTKDRYFEMCEMLNSEPVDSEVPIDFSDLPSEVQICLQVYSFLQDEWEYMGGNYVGKKMANIFQIFQLFDVPVLDYKYFYEIILHLDRLKTEHIQKEQKRKSKPA